MRGPEGYENWRGARDDAATHAYEVLLYSDARVTGDSPVSDQCPYGFLNTLAFDAPGRLAPIVALRVFGHGVPKLPPMEETDTSRYHGGLLVDELAALASLALGIRLRPGGVTRDFTVGSDPLGRHRGDVAVPVLLPSRSAAAVRVPRARTVQNLNGLLVPRLERYVVMSPEDAISLVKAARLYQDALWVAESTPELSWLFLVSALEAIATPLQVQTADAAGLLQSSHPKLAAVLVNAGGDALLDAAAAELLPLLRATGRFIDFVMSHLPPPPQQRPHPDLCVSWERGPMKRALSTIYGYRSSALHEGTPFPQPMCDIQPIPAELPVGLASASHGAVWVRADLPMLLHVFEYIARGAILTWWDKAASAS